MTGSKRITPPPDVATVVALARRGLTLQAIGDRVGRTRGRVHQILKAHGYSIKALRNIRCAACGGLVGKAELTTRSGRHYCVDPACQPAYERDKRDHEWQELRALIRAIEDVEARKRPQRSAGHVTAYAVPVEPWQRLRARARAVVRARPRARPAGGERPRAPGTSGAARTANAA
jgi:hypothetical protein